MGLLDQIGSILEQEGGNARLLQGVIAWIDSQGGIAALIAKFQQGGLGEIAQSWIANGQNHPISGEQVSSLLGNGELESLASSMGVAPEQASAMLAQVLPGIVDGLSPSGSVPEHGNLLENGLEMLAGKLLG
ncbi:YidB family protein [Shimwellia blattae]|uniref:DUF937 domain-containing protein n=1 Tax=Shimwellia blattae (strain ATCC 29907 / DSM 4481 / JCM 1650 / NBRC 105725 / CDC 9005-74) TaxID=630626 RepID=I2B8G6_SHIBC|nr:YidB family protein [Shimwellia blattae]AFJ46820.1 hypothetical protein EBL_c17260 [Shimwellia blattae DSM 4481 = NBRC 105725]GAB82960.1 hypothetical protein YidB [Shimwellia blattae DSM 4481 = NBRC 105725]VDY64299.1 Uncharacterized protein conserved in bacteria [Shimwellia blattae]VEC22424.1 Uncharacterized protein conserved in bacteria [Shimwellia blattae]